MLRTIKSGLLFIIITASVIAEPLVIDFDDLPLGMLNGNAGWSAPDHCTIVMDPLEGSSSFSQHVLQIEPNADTMWATIVRTEMTISRISFDFLIQEDSFSGKPETIWIRFLVGWGNHIGVDPFTDGGIVEITGKTGNSRASLNMPYDQVHRVEIEYNLVGTTATSAEVFLNGESVGVIEDLSTDMSVGSVFQIRGWRCTAFVDNIVLTPITTGPSEPNVADSFTEPVYVANGIMPAIAVDSKNNLHLIYGRDQTLYYRVGDLNGNFGEEEVIAHNAFYDPRIILDTDDNPHVVFADGRYKNQYTFYTNRMGGSWRTIFPVFDNVADKYDRATTPHMAIDSDGIIYITCFTIGENSLSETNTAWWGALAKISIAGEDIQIIAKERVEPWNPQVFLSDGKLWIGGRDLINASNRQFTLAEYDKDTLKRITPVIESSPMSHTEMARGVVDNKGLIHSAGTIDKAGFELSGWYSAFDPKSGTVQSIVSYPTTRVNPNGAGMPVVDLVKKDRVYVFYWSDITSITPHESTDCVSGEQLRFMRIENGIKESTHLPVTERSVPHGPSYRLTPAAVAHPAGGAIVIFGECNSGDIFLTTVGEPKWNNYYLINEWAYTSGWMGWAYVGESPWIWQPSLGWIWVVPQANGINGGWVYLQDIPALQPDTEDAPWLGVDIYPGFSWLYVPDYDAELVSGWGYLVSEGD